MDYSQFLYMRDEISLIAVIVILFFADLFLCADRKEGQPSKILTVIPSLALFLQTIYVMVGISPDLSDQWHDVSSEGHTQHRYNYCLPDG